MILFLTILTGPLAGAISALIVTWCLGRRARSRERRALLVAFGTELVELFRRSVKIFEYTSKGGFLRSELYMVTDPSMLAKLASVIDNPTLINLIISLKERYFQIQKHVEESAQYFYEWNVTDGEMQSNDASKEASRRCRMAQLMAAKFFEFPQMYEWTQKLLSLLEPELTRSMFMDLENRFYESAKVGWGVYGSKIMGQIAQQQRVDELLGPAKGKP